jgi:hypothetical protein
LALAQKKTLDGANILCTMRSITVMLSTVNKGVSMDYKRVVYIGTKEDCELAKTALKDEWDTDAWTIEPALNEGPDEFGLVAPDRRSKHRESFTEGFLAGIRWERARAAAK